MKNHRCHSRFISTARGQKTLAFQTCYCHEKSRSPGRPGRIFAVIALSLLLLITGGCSAQSKNHPAPEKPSVDVKALMDQMTLEEKLGQMLVVSIDGTALSPQTVEYLQQYHIGNVILYARNITDRGQLSALCAQIQDTICTPSGIPALIGIDQEGGMVNRIADGATAFPGNMAVAATDNPENAKQIGQYMGEELRALGINVNFAPVLDVNSNPDNPAINVRSYSDDAKTVGKYGLNMAEGLQSQGILACGKHFPGHGDTQIDSHYGLPMVDKSAETLETTELYPFKKAIDGGIGMIMTTHILFPSLEPDELPATMSKRILTGLLREKLGFQGLIITDSIQMEAAQIFGIAEGAKAAATAGADLILTGTGSAPVPGEPDPQLAALSGLAAAAKDGTLSQKRIDDAVRRILTCKAELGLFDGCLPDPGVQAADWSSHAAFSQAVANASITLVKDEQGLLPSVAAPSSASDIPVSESTSHVETAVDMNITYRDTLFISPRTSAGLSLAEAAGQKFGSGALQVSANPKTSEIREAAQRAKNYERVVIVTTDARRKTGQAALVNRVVAVNPSTVVISMGIPYDIREFPKAGTYICAYEYTPAAVSAVLSALSGEIPMTGKLPVTIPLK